jgi:hypothetical protein
MFRPAENEGSFIARSSRFALLALCLALSACTSAAPGGPVSEPSGSSAVSPAPTSQPSQSEQPLASQSTEAAASAVASSSPSSTPSPSPAPAAKSTPKPTAQPTAPDGCGPGASTPVNTAQAPVPNIKSGYFAAAAPIPKGSGSDAAILLTNGKVLVLGAGRALLYNPATNTFSPAGAMVVERRGPLAAKLPGGKVLVIGGDTFQGCALGNIDDVEMYDAATNRFSRITSPIVGDVYQAATTLADGTVLLTGGWTVDDAYPDGIRSSALFDPVTMKFTLLDGSLQPQPGAAVTTLPDGTVLFAGGLVDSGNTYSYVAIDTAVLYRPATRDFAPVTGTMTVPRANATATLLPDGTVLITGGRSTDEAGDAENYYLSSAELYDYRTGQFTATGSMLNKRSEHTATLLPGGSVLIVGSAGTSAEIWSNGSFHATAGPMTHPRSSPATVVLPDGRVLVVGEGTADLYRP